MDVMRRPLARRLAMTAVVVLPCAVRAQSTAPPLDAARQALVDSASRLFRRGDSARDRDTPDEDRRALPLFVRAAALSHQAGDQLNEAESLRRMGWIFGRRARPDSALAYHRAALTLYLAGGRPFDQAMSLGDVAGALNELRQPDSALVYWHRALALFHDNGYTLSEASTLNSIGIIYQALDRRDSAIAYFRRALPLARQADYRLGQTIALGQIGSAFLVLGHPDSALACYRETEALYRAANDSNGVALTLRTIGTTYMMLSRSDSALAAASHSLAIARATGNREGETASLSLLGRMYFDLGRPDSALAYYDRALPHELESGDTLGVTTTLNAIGMIHRNNGRPDSALVYLRRAIALSRAAQLRGFQMAGLFNSVGAIFSSLNQPDSALAYLQPALHLMRAAGYRAGESLVLSDIGSTFLRLGRADSAMTYERLALPLARAAGYREVEANALFEMGLASMLRRELTGALSYFDSSAAIFARVRRSAGGDANSIGYTEQRFALYPVWATTWLGAARFGMVDSARAVAAALAVSERGRAQALRDLLRRGAAATDTIAGADLVAEGNALLAPLRRSHTAVLSYLFLGDGLITWLLLPSGELRLLGTRMVPHDSLASTVAIVRGALGADSLRGGASAERESAVGLGLQIPRSSADVDRARSALSRMLSLPDVERALPDHNTELVIIPQGVLGLVPFAALPVSPSMMLSERFSLRFSPSIAFLANEGDSVGDRARGLRPALVVGNPTMPRGSMRALPAAEQEARSVARTLGAEPLTGAAATEAVVRHAMGDARVVHLATHGLAYGSDARVRDSYIALAPDAGDDGLLTVGELLDDDRLHLRAELVVLSACQTGLGDLKQAEGTVGLQRAFLAKGARSLLVSLWSVDDRATALLMTRFYAHWLHDSDHPDKAESLRRAQSDVRRTRGFADPRYWAAFQLVGAR